MNSSLIQVSCSSNSSVEQHMYPTVYSLFFIVGFPSNCLSLFVAWKLALQGNNMAVYLVSLSVSDLLYTVTLPVWIGMAQRWNVSDQLCGVMYLIMYNSFYVGSGLLCCISVDRYLAVVYPLHFHWVREVRAAALLSTAVWLLEISLHVLLLHHMGALQSFNLCHQPMPLTQKDADVALVRVVLGFLLPLVIMTLCFQQIMQSLRRSRSVLQEERRRVGLLLLLLLLTYIASFVPYQTVMILRVVLEPGACDWARGLRDPYLVTVAMTTLNSTLDPIFYCLINESAKREIGRAMNRGRRRFIKTRIQAVS